MKGSKHYNLFWLLGYVVDDTARLIRFLIVLGALAAVLALAAAAGLRVWP